LKATLVILDESGFSLLPTPCKTRAPWGPTPFLHHCFNWPKSSALSAVTPHPHAYLSLVRGTITSPHVIRFLRHLLRGIPGISSLFWDGLNTHRSKKTRAALAEHHARLRVYRLPAYGPELNPDEGLWARMKQRALAGQCPPNLQVLEQATRQALRRLRRRPQIIRSFFHRWSLFLTACQPIYAELLKSLTQERPVPRVTVASIHFRAII
jgi:transposase